jgi:hypothetical protein
MKAGMGKKNHAFCDGNGGFMVIQVLMGLLLFAIIAGAIGYFVYSVTPSVTASHAFALQQGAAHVMEQIRQDAIRATLVEAPPAPTGNTPVTGQGLSFSWTDSNAVYTKVVYQMNGAGLTRTVNGGNAETLLLSWDNGAITLANGSYFQRGVDTDSVGGITGCERDMIRVHLVLNQTEGGGILKTQVFEMDFMPRNIICSTS